MVVYNWNIVEVLARPSFTDKNGIQRQNVIKAVKLIYKGVDEEAEKQVSSHEKIVNFSLVDLSNFTDHSQLNKTDVLNWALAEINAEEKLRIENSVKAQMEDLTPEPTIIKLDLAE